ncbi:wall-associated receptor kinase-like protein 22 [Cinnamomum micranthum f. kanehirae]|uniref:Wall-associated receptor kinase-like protein 22 n=1 Tax=Cinnamomum micranthum f. kanehirae TaxID=337451 RepID=A0A3S3MP00_9MAGN|nr:wall-associated receptor kinase-like protein 22 [Cinnamomum micranthum f. kanehirae]
MSPFDLLFKKKKKRKSLLGKRQGEEGVLEDGARLLKEVIASCDGRGCYPIRMFSAKEIEEAIKEPCNYGPDIDYWGIYQGRLIYIKLYNVREFAFNEIVVLSQVKHTNVVKFMGCCFEMERPISILEYVPYSLYSYLFEANPSSSSALSWDHRLRIAIDIAHAITYLHVGTSRPIVHRDIKCFNILLDEHFKSKLSDFSLSVTIPVGETHVQTHAAGTLGYIDGDHATTGYVCEKTDVYSYGVVLFELLSGKKLLTLIERDPVLDLSFWDSIHRDYR